MKQALYLSAALVLGGAARPAPAPEYVVPSVEDAFATWIRLCVRTMPDRAAFAAAFAADPGWVELRKPEGVAGLFWRSPRGELSYVDAPHPTEANLGCHYTFRTAPNFTHDGAANLLSWLFEVDGGGREGNARAPQTRWDATLANGTRVRIFLSTGVPAMGGPAARLSISAYRDAPARR